MFLIPFMLTCSMMRYLSLSLLGMCACVVSVVMWLLFYVDEVVLVHYVDAVVAVIVMRVLLFVLHVCMLRECENASVTAMLVEKVWLWWVKGMSMWVVHLVQVLCLAQLTC